MIPVPVAVLISSVERSGEKQYDMDDESNENLKDALENLQDHVAGLQSDIEEFASKLDES